MNYVIQSRAVGRGWRVAAAVAGVLAVIGAAATTIAATNATPCTCVSELIVNVSNLPLPARQSNALLKTLERTRRQITLCHVVQAGQLTTQFVRQIQALVDRGSLDAATCNSLTVCAYTIDLCRPDCSESSPHQPPVALAKPLVLSADAQCQADPPASEFDNGSYDPDGIIVNYSVMPPGPYPLGTTLVTYSVVDNSGSFSSVSTAVTVKETTGPTVSNFSPNFVVYAGPGQTNGTAIFPNPLVSDSCSGVASLSFLPPSGSVFPLGVSPDTLIVVDGLGNTNQFPFNVVVLPYYGGGGGGGGNGGGDSNQPPVAIAYAAVTLAADSNCQAVVTVDEVDNHSFDPDGTIVERFVEPTGPFPVGTVTNVTLTVVDNQGASNSTVSTVTVLDLTPPTILTPPSDITVATALGQQSVIVDYPTLSVTDNCSSVAGVIYTPPSGTAFGVGTNTVTCQVFDAAGNTNSVNFRVIVPSFAASACDTIPGLIQLVQSLPLNGTYNGGREGALLLRLEKAQQNVAMTRLKTADYFLRGFILACSVYRDLGVLEFQTATDLILCATNIDSHIYDSQQ